MLGQDKSPLDNIIWHALSSSQSHFAEVNGPARRFFPAIGPLGGFTGPAPEGIEAIAELIDGPRQAVALFLPESVETTPNLKVLRSIPLLQMLHDGRRPPAHPEVDYVTLGDADIPEMISLTKLTEPGPFEQRTIELGGYIGVRRNGQLASMAGERLRIPGYTEISAVCTHPEHTGHGYAAALMTAIIERLIDRGDVPFLHSRHDNDRAIELYERIGFRRHAMLHLLVIAVQE
jgi:ribosomal protein S18 acetylase RimI-like enzyme